MDDKEIKVTPYSNGNGAKIDIYSPSAKENPHDSIHIKINTETGSGKIIEKESGSSREETDTQCYLTTACMKHFSSEFDDNCYELSTLRWFRDKFVSKEDIDHYYEIAPSIVEAINKISSKDEIYNYIYENIINVCVKAIEQGEYEFAYNRYKNSVLTLEEEYADPLLKKGTGKVLTLSKGTLTY